MGEDTTSSFIIYIICAIIFTVSLALEGGIKSDEQIQKEIDHEEYIRNKQEETGSDLG